MNGQKRIIPVKKSRCLMIFFLSLHMITFRIIWLTGLSPSAKIFLALVLTIYLLSILGKKRLFPTDSKSLSLILEENQSRLFFDDETHCYRFQGCQLSKNTFLIRYQDNEKIKKLLLCSDSLITEDLYYLRRSLKINSHRFVIIH